MYVKIFLGGQLHTWAPPTCYNFWSWSKGQYTCNVNFMAWGWGKHPSKHPPAPLYGQLSQNGRKLSKNCQKLLILSHFYTFWGVRPILLGVSISLGESGQEPAKVKSEILKNPVFCSIKWVFLGQMQFLERIYFWENTQKRYNYVPFIENSEKTQFYENSMPGRPTYFPTGWEVWLNPPDFHTHVWFKSSYDPF